MFEVVLHLLLKGDNLLQVFGSFRRPVVNRARKGWDAVVEPKLVIQSLLEPFGERLFAFLR